MPASSSLDRVRLVVSSLGFTVPLVYLLKRVAYQDHFYHLRAPMGRLRFPRLRSDIRCELATEADLDEIVRGLGALDLASRKEVVARVLFHRAGFSSCYIGRSPQNELVSMQWLLRPQDNALLERQRRRLYYPLRSDEAMVENIFIFPRFRGLSVFPTVNHFVLDLAKREGFRACNAYIRKDNIPSLNAFMGLGFQIQKLLTGYNLAGLSWRNL
ncbi:hypothetical protein [Anaeromyxobacter soli]|uniref:hypothetical protein n=1 Tax=Anaeromyxobacter soli TaxID=2922725 RepID=UPI001FB04103|nr:hypothetical protein [Anaeromyxobacter sp. SG29]